MAYRVDVTARADRDLGSIYRRIRAEDSVRAAVWFNGLGGSIASLAQDPARCPVTPEDGTLRHLLYGKRRDVYRVIFAVDESAQVVTVLHIRNGARSPLHRAHSQTRGSL